MPSIGLIGAQVDLVIRQGARFGPNRVTLENPDGTPVNLTGCTVRAQLRRRALDTDKLADFQITVDDAAAGKFTFGLSAAQTAALPAGETTASTDSKAVWDLELQDSAGDPLPIFWGDVQIFREVTRD